MTVRSLVSVAAALAAYGLLAPALAQQAPIKLGSFLAVTGPASLLGDPEKKTLEHFVDLINKEGGVLGRKVQLVLYDTGSEAKNAVTFVKRLIEEDRVDFIIGGTTTGETMAVVPMVEQAGVPFISQAGASVVIDPVKKWVFKTPHTDVMAVTKVYEDMKRNGIAKVGLIAGDGGYDKACLGTAQNLAANHGITIVASEAFGRGDTDFTPQVTKLKNAPGIQAALFCGFGSHAVILNKNWRQLAISFPQYHNHGSCSKEILRGSGPAAEGVKMPCPAVVVADKLPANDPNKKAAMNYTTEYTSRFKEEVSTFGAHTYDGLILMVDAIKRAGTTDKAKVRDALEQTKNFAGSSGVFNMSPTDHMGLSLSDFKMLQVSGGDWKILE